MARFPLTCGLLVACTSLRGGEQWVVLASLPTPRQEVGVAEAGGKIYLLGGILGDRQATDLAERYDPVQDRWESLPPLPRKLHHVGAAALEGKVYCLGGLDQAFNGVNSCFVFDPEQNAWETLTPLPSTRGAMGAAALDGRIYAAGGQRGVTVRDFAAFTPGPEGGSWEVLPQMPTARNHLAAAAAGGYFFALSGRAGALRPEVERYDPRTRSWSDRSPIPTPRGGIAAASLGPRIFVFGGEGNRAQTSGVFPQCEVYDVFLDRWFTRLAMTVPRHGIGAAALGGRIYLPGGAEVEGFGVTAVNTAYEPPAEDLEAALFVRGDANRDLRLDISDPVAILFVLFGGHPAASCLDARDANDDGRVDIADAVRVLEHLYAGALAPPSPGPEPGLDPTPDLIDC